MLQVYHTDKISSFLNISYGGVILLRSLIKCSWILTFPSNEYGFFPPKNNKLFYIMQHVISNVILTKIQHYSTHIHLKFHLISQISSHKIST